MMVAKYDFSSEDSQEKFNKKFYGECFMNQEGALDRCDQLSLTSLKILGIGFMLIVNVLLMNLLVAVFATSYEKVMEQAEGIWKYQRSKLVVEYKDRSSFPVPISIL